MSQLFAHQLYCSQAWIDLRLRLIVERGPVCQRCHKIIPDTSKLTGHHIKELTPANINDPMITLNPDNIEIICFDCHNKDHRRFGYHRQEVYLIYGSPCSGKSSLVHQLARRGDMILDIDRLYECISGLPAYDKPDNLRFNVFALRDKMIDMIKTRYGKWNDAYMIGGYPNKYERERVARELGATLIYCDGVSAEVCKTRAMQAGRPVDWVRWIDKWWAEYAA